MGRGGVAGIDNVWAGAVARASRAAVGRWGAAQRGTAGAMGIHPLPMPAESAITVWWGRGGSGKEQTAAAAERKGGAMPAGGQGRRLWGAHTPAVTPALAG